MDSLIARLDAWVIALTFAGAMTAFFTLGSWWGRRFPAPTGDHGGKFTDASMALLGLLLAFTFSMALNRYDDRRAATVAESNAIGDLYTCATLLPEPGRSKLQTLLADYTTHRLDARRTRALRYEPELVMREAREMHTRATAIVAALVEERSPITVPLVNTLNDVTSSYATYLAAYRERLPGIVLVLLLLGAIIPAFLMGRQGALNTVHVSGPIAFGVLVTVVIYVIFDLNQPSGGVITVGEEAWVQLLQSMAK